MVSLSMAFHSSWRYAPNSIAFLLWLSIMEKGVHGLAVQSVSMVGDWGWVWSVTEEKAQAILGIGEIVHIAEFLVLVGIIMDGAGSGSRGLDPTIILIIIAGKKIFEPPLRAVKFLIAFEGLVA